MLSQLPVREGSDVTARTRLLSATALLAGTLLAGTASLPVRAQTGTGKTAFERSCASCHGSDATGSFGPALVPFAASDQDLMDVVRAGGSQMRPLSSSDI